MTTTTALTPEQLDELEWWGRVAHFGDEAVEPDDTGEMSWDELYALIAMAKRTEQAVRERDALRDAVKSIMRFYDDSRAEPEYERAQTMGEIARAALAQPTDAGGAE